MLGRKLVYDYCPTCGRKVIMDMTKRIEEEEQWFLYCSEVCRLQHRNVLRRKYPSKLVCEVCGTAFTAKRSDAKTCSAACKQKAYRTRKKIEKEAA
jgi:hypothetical protein